MHHFWIYVNGPYRTPKTKTREMLGTDIYLNSEIIGYGANQKSLKLSIAA